MLFCMYFNDDDKFISSSDKHPLKVKQSIFSTEYGIVIFTSEEHLAKQPFLIVFTEGGIVIFSNDEHLKKAYLPNDTIDD